MSFGMFKRFEDFCPLDDETALIVCGKTYTELTKIVRVNYQIKKNKVFLSSPTILLTGKYLRLGNIFNDQLTFSDDYSIYKANMNDLSNRIFVCMGIQPYTLESDIVYQKYYCIYLNNKKIITPLDDYIVIGRPTIHQDWIYYEARRKPAPQGWEIWRYNLKSRKKEMVLQSGANPYVYNGKLFYSSWVSGKPIFGLEFLRTHFQVLAKIYSGLGLYSRFETRCIKI